mmetsp:Transcript_59756/g.96785  ORF Transcript_59756/g.96785 Transcript_59756/m.96785 type:complete len:135 (-) Transcript_59756:195-599(-)
MNINGRTSPTDGTPNRLFQRFVSDLQPLNQSGRALQNLLQHGADATGQDVEYHVPITYPDPELSGLVRDSLLLAHNVSAGQGIDYAFISSSSSSKVVQVQGSARVDAMRVDDRDSPFVTLSDHFAIEFALRCIP